MDSNILEILKFYRDGKITNSALEYELMDVFAQVSHMNVVIDDNQHVGNSGTYVLIVLPELVNGIIKNTLILDKAVFKILTDEEICEALLIAERCIPINTKRYLDFYTRYKDSEVGKTECLQLYLDIHGFTMEDLLNVKGIKQAANSKIIDLDKINDVKLALTNGNESIDRIIEYININNLLPKIAMEQIENTFTKINKPVTLATEVGNAPIENDAYNKIKSVVTGNFDPNTSIQNNPLSWMDLKK